MTLRQRVVHNFRRILGTDQGSAVTRNEYMTVLQRLDQLDAKLSEFVAPDPEPAGPLGATLIELNGDRLWLPDDLIKYVWHTRVSPDGAAIPQFLAETDHYLWIRDRLRIADVALDIGANMGLFTAMMAKRVKYGVTGYVHALEPSPAAHDDLCRLMQVNGIDNVYAPMYAISDRCGRAAFMTIEEGSVAREASCLADLDRQGVLPGTAKGQIEVETITLDKYLADHSMRPKLIKIDVEGAEFLVLEGGREFIRDAHPLLVIEIHEDASGEFDHGRLRQYLDEYGYRYQNRHKIYFCE